MIDLRLGDWREIGPVDCDSLITDPPYSARTHEGQRSNGPEGWMGGSSIEYPGIDRAYCDAFVFAWLPHVRKWWVLCGDHISNRWWIDAMEAAGLQTFAPVPWVRHAGPRVTGDGPTSGAEYLAVARTRGKWATNPPWGSLPGHYDCPTANQAGEGVGDFVGQKPLRLMRAIVRDYSRPGWMICDPHAGSGTTLVAAEAEGRSCIGWERDPATYAKAKARLDAPKASPLFPGHGAA